MTMGIVITEEQIQAARDYIETLSQRMNDPTISEKDRMDYLRLWLGARRVFRKMGLQEIYKS